MYHSWLDRWDDKRAQRGNALKCQTVFSLDAHLAFPIPESENIGIADFIRLVERAVADDLFLKNPRSLISTIHGKMAGSSISLILKRALRRTTVFKPK